jgi:serine/threonine protein kinase
MVSLIESKNAENAVLLKVDDHENGFIPSNNVFISDFGIRSWFTKYNRITNQMMRVVGTVQYVAPEVLQNGKPALPADIWALGCIGYELFTGKRFFESEAMIENYIRTEYIDPIELARIRERPWMCGVLSGCLQINPDDRSTVWKLHEILDSAV